MNGLIWIIIILVALVLIAAILGAKDDQAKYSAFFDIDEEEKDWNCWKNPYKNDDIHDDDEV